MWFIAPEGLYHWCMKYVQRLFREAVHVRVPCRAGAMLDPENPCPGPERSVAHIWTGYLWPNGYTVQRIFY